LFDNAGVSSSSGDVPTSVEEMAQHAAAFVDALGIKKVDALGFSIGGTVAQQLTIDRPDLVRKLILVGTGPRGGEGMASFTPEAQEIFGAKYDLQTSCGFASSSLHRSPVRPPEGNISSARGRARRTAIRCRTRELLRHRQRRCRSGALRRTIPMLT
jgi:pimeloyl-ACP methyl ester carboxylesterase